jgi:uncharacterized protein HemX
MAARTGISVTTIQRIWAEANLKPHRTPSATPAATNTSSNSSGGSGSPLFALLVCLAFGSVALLMAEKQRRTVRR